MSEETVSPNGVHIAGNFQNWDPATTTMTDGDADGIYEVTVDLNGNNTYLYKFINGNAWGEDESVPGECAMDNSRVLDLATSAVTTEAFCFGSCTACATSTTDIDLDNSLRLYPNPSNGLVYLMFDQSGAGEVQVKCYDVLSQMVFKQRYSVTSGQNSIAVDIRENGMFMLTIQTSRGIATRKVMIER